MLKWSEKFTFYSPYPHQDFFRVPSNKFHHFLLKDDDLMPPNMSLAERDLFPKLQTPHSSRQLDVTPMFRKRALNQTVPPRQTGLPSCQFHGGRTVLSCPEHIPVSSPHPTWPNRCPSTQSTSGILTSPTAAAPFQTLEPTLSPGHRNSLQTIPPSPPKLCVKLLPAAKSEV